MSNTVLQTYPDADVVQSKLCEFIVDKSQKAITSSGSFLLGVSGLFFPWIIDSMFIIYYKYKFVYIHVIGIG